MVPAIRGGIESPTQNERRQSECESVLRDEGAPVIPLIFTTSSNLHCDPSRSQQQYKRGAYDYRASFTNLLFSQQELSFYYLTSSSIHMVALFSGGVWCRGKIYMAGVGDTGH